MALKREARQEKIDELLKPYRRVMMALKAVRWELERRRG
jgi:hypothetical protein